MTKITVEITGRRAGFVTVDCDGKTRKYERKLNTILREDRKSNPRERKYAREAFDCAEDFEREFAKPEREDLGEKLSKIPKVETPGGINPSQTQGIGIIGKMKNAVRG